MGSILGYVFDKVNDKLPEQKLIFSMARFLFGGIIGAASFLVLKSGFLLKLIYPNLSNALTVEKADVISYQSIVSVSVICGIFGPALVKGLRKHASAP